MFTDNMHCPSAPDNLYKDCIPCFASVQIHALTYYQSLFISIISFVYTSFSFQNALIKRPARDACLHMGGILTEGSAVSAGSASLPTYSVFTYGWNLFKLGTYI